LTQKINTQIRYWKSAPVYSGSGFQCLFPTNFYFVKVANFCWQNISLHRKNTFLQHEVYLASCIPRWNVLPYYSTKRFYSLQK
jgi:hypothetical protein